MIYCLDSVKFEVQCYRSLGQLRTAVDLARTSVALLIEAVGAKDSATKDAAALLQIVTAESKITVCMRIYCMFQ